ncbi:MAG: AAA family ATPase, partial [Eubacteriaceae bacterium]|nr:AAA family ATPase [Eubacteriaceae bacterium]
MNRVMIAGTNSNVGKTTVSMGIMAALRKRGLNVAPFKVGPDYIDPGFHKFVTGNPSYNLDSYLLDENSVKYLINNNNNTGADIGIIEGVMGFYDAFGLVDPRGSSAHVSIVTKTPVILVIDG